MSKPFKKVIGVVATTGIYAVTCVKKEVYISCAYCKNAFNASIDAGVEYPSTHIVYCEHCRKANKVSVPAAKEIE